MIIKLLGNRKNKVAGIYILITKGITSFSIEKNVFSCIKENQIKELDKAKIKYKVFG